MFKFGFELEGFCYDDNNKLIVPPKEYPTDGFPGLVELRTRGPNDLVSAYTQILMECLEYQDVTFDVAQDKFDAEQRAILRRRHEVKDCVDIRNLYGRKPRLLGDRTIASLQINISNEISHEYWDKDRVHHPAVYGLFDIPQVVKNFDEEFAADISDAGRQPGEYAIKDHNRLEYRSLPNFTFVTSFGPPAKQFINRIERCVNY